MNVTGECTVSASREAVFDKLADPFFFASCFDGVSGLTNIALAVRRYPPLVEQVADFVIMGGSAGRGNTTPAAEFNIWCDPEAAAIAFGAGWRVTMAGLDVTHQALATA